MAEGAFVGPELPLGKVDSASDMEYDDTKWLFQL
jgi:hypothetical protein